MCVCVGSYLKLPNVLCTKIKRALAALPLGTLLLRLLPDKRVSCGVASLVKGLGKRDWVNL